MSSQVGQPSFVESVERLKHALHVMEILTAEERQLFSLLKYAIRTRDGVRACIAGHCGLNPWFQELGFRTTVDWYFGSVSIPVRKFFGTEEPFYVSYYGRIQNPTVDDAKAALKRSIAKFQHLAATIPDEHGQCHGPVTVIYECVRGSFKEPTDSMLHARTLCLELVVRFGPTVWNSIRVQDANGLEHRPKDLWGTMS
jgi:hypothetical protein